MEQTSNAFLGQEKIGRLMVKFAVPCVISLLVGALYNMVDQVYIGWGVGYLGNGATNVVFPLTVVALAVATMIGDGACAYVSIRLGARDEQNAGRAVGSAVLTAFLASLVITAVYALWQEPLLNLFGATPGNLPYARDYMTYITVGIPFYVVGQALNPIIRSDGNPRFAMIATLSGAILNVVLDPIAIFALGWGVKGAAIATAVGQVLSAGLSLWYLARRMHAVRLNRDCFRLWPSLMKHYLPLGLCSLLSQMSMVIAMGFTQTALRTHGSGTVYGADIPLTVIGIVCKFLQIVMSVVIGVAAGCIPVVGYNIGAGRKDRVREVLKRMMLCEAAVGFAALALFQLFPRQLISLFGSENELYLSFAERAFRIYLGMVPLACVNKAAFIFLQAMGKPVASTFLSFLREVVLAVPLVLLLPVWLGLDGVLYSMPLADLIACAASAWVLVSVHKELKA